MTVCFCTIPYFIFRFWFLIMSRKETKVVIQSVTEGKQRFCRVFRPSKCLLHHLQRRCNIFLACVNLLLLTYGVLQLILFLVAFLGTFCVKVPGNEAEVILQFYWRIYRVFLGYFIAKSVVQCILQKLRKFVEI